MHTDVNTHKVLEDGLGYLEWMVVARILPDGSIGASVGLVFSAREFPHPLDDRLTDERWNQMLRSGEAAGPPVWMQSVRHQP